MNRKFVNCISYKVGIAVLLSLACAFSTKGQVRNPEQLNHLQTAIRDPLLGRLNLYIEYGAKQQYEEQYNLVAQTYLREWNFSKEGYAEESREFAKKVGCLVGFYIKRVSIDEDQDQVWLYGIIQTQYEGKLVEDHGYVRATLEEGRWVFEKWYITI